MMWCAERTIELAHLVFRGLALAEREKARSHVRGCRGCAVAVRQTRIADLEIGEAFDSRLRAERAAADDDLPPSVFEALVAARRRSRTFRRTAAAALAASVMIAAMIMWSGDAPAPGSSRVVTADAAGTPEQERVAPGPDAAMPSVALTPEPVVPPPAGQNPAPPARPEVAPAPEASPRPAVVALGPPAPVQPAAVSSGAPEVPDSPTGPEPGPPAEAAGPVREGPGSEPSPADRLALDAATQVLAGAERAFEQGEWRRAAQALGRIPPLSTPGPGADVLVRARRLEGWCALRENDVPQARARFAAALTLAPKDAEASAGAGLCGLMAGAAGAGLEELRTATARWSDWGSLRAARGWALVAAGDIPAARRDFDAARRLVPKSASAAAGLGWSFYLQGDAAGAEPLFEEALRLIDRKAPGDTAGPVDDAWILALEEHRIRTRQRYATAAGHGFCAWARGDAAATLERLEPLTARRAESPDAAGCREEVFETVAWAMLDSGRASAALKEFRRLAAARPEGPTRARAVAAQGWCELALGRKSEARAAFEAALGKSADDPTALEGLAVLEGRAPAGRVPGSAHAGSMPVPGSSTPPSGPPTKPMPRGTGHK